MEAWKTLDVSEMTETEIWEAWKKLTEAGNDCFHGKDGTILYRPEPKVYTVRVYGQRRLRKVTADSIKEARQIARKRWGVIRQVSLTEMPKPLPMQVPSFKPGDIVENVIGGWVGVIVRKNPIRNNGYRVEWTDTKGARFATKFTDLSPLNLRLVRSTPE